MTYSLPYVFIPGDDWGNITMSPGVSREMGRRVLETMRFFANRPIFEEYLMNGGVGWADIPYTSDGLRLHYRTLVRSGLRPQIYGLGFFHDAETRNAAGSLVTLAANLDKNLSGIEPANSFPNHKTFTLPDIPVRQVARGETPWLELRGETIVCSTDAAYNIINEHSVGEGDWVTNWEILFNMHRIEKNSITAFITYDFPIQKLVRLGEKNPASDTLDFVNNSADVAHPVPQTPGKILLLTIACLTVGMLIAIIVLYLSPSKGPETPSQQNNAMENVIQQEHFYDDQLGSDEPEPQSILCKEIEEVLFLNSITQPSYTY